MPTLIQQQTFCIRWFNKMYSFGMPFLNISTPLDIKSFTDKLIQLAYYTWANSPKDNKDVPNEGLWNCQQIQTYDMIHVFCSTKVSRNYFNRAKISTEKQLIHNSWNTCSKFYHCPKIIPNYFFRRWEEEWWHWGYEDTHLENHHLLNVKHLWKPECVV